MPKGIKKHRSALAAMAGPLYATPDGAGGDSQGGGGGTPTPATTPPAGQTEDAQSNGGGTGDEALGEGGKKALEREREARKAAEKRADEQATAIAEALGITPGKKDGPAELITHLQSRLDQIQHDAAVDRTARLNAITDESDLALLRSTANVEQMEALAARLKPSENPTGTPKPDNTQGSKGGDNSPQPSPGVPRLAKAFEDAFNQ